MVMEIWIKICLAAAAIKRHTMTGACRVPFLKGYGSLKD
jgi:hypothetical protein